MPFEISLRAVRRRMPLCRLILMTRSGAPAASACWPRNCARAQARRRFELCVPFVGIVETLCGSLIILGLLTRVAAMPLIHQQLHMDFGFMALFGYA